MKELEKRSRLEQLIEDKSITRDQVDKMEAVVKRAEYEQSGLINEAGYSQLLREFQNNTTKEVNGLLEKHSAFTKAQIDEAKRNPKTPKNRRIMESLNEVKHSEGYKKDYSKIYSKGVKDLVDGSELINQKLKKASEERKKTLIDLDDID